MRKKKNKKWTFSIILEPVKNIARDADPLVRDLGKYSLVFIAIMIPVSLLLFQIEGMITFIVSSLFMLLNFIWLKEIVDVFTMRTSGETRKARGITGFFAMFLLLGICLYAIITIRWIKPVPVLLGISTLVAAAFGVSMKELFKLARKKKRA